MRGGTGSGSVGRRSGDPAAEPALRAHLLEERSEFRNLMARTLLEDSAESAEFAFRECSKAVDPLIAGAPVWLHRFELPDSHPMRVHGHPCDSLELGEDNVLREEISRAPCIQPDPVRRSTGNGERRFDV